MRKRIKTILSFILILAVCITSLGFDLSVIYASYNENTNIMTEYFYYTGNVQEFTAPYDGEYALTVAGAQGGNSYYYGQGGYGGETSGKVNLKKGQKIYIVVGGSGTYSVATNIELEGGYNGGGSSGNSYSNYSRFYPGSSGGGATHISITNRGELKNYFSYKSELLLVAGGGGGAGYYSTNGGERGLDGGAGGGIEGTNGKAASGDNDSGKGGTQTSGGNAGRNSTWNLWGEKGEFGQGANGIFKGNSFGYGSGGGGGFYGGGSSPYCVGSGGGGSGYIGNVIDGTMTTGTNAGNGWATISYPCSCVTYDANGGVLLTDGTSTSVSEKKELNSEYTVKPEIFKRTGYIFDGWNEKADGAGTSWKEGETFMVSTLKTLYAQWEIIPYTISYELNGGEISGELTKYNVETNSYTLPTPTKNGYNFLGWTGSNGSTPQKTVIIPKGSTGDRTYTANWERAIDQLTVNPNGGTINGSNDSLIIKINELTQSYEKAYNYTGNVQEIKLTPGDYKLETWGAQGGGSNGGLGGYSSGNLKVTTDTTLYGYVGGQGTLSNGLGSGGGYNGGGAGGNGGYGGGGMTHISTVNTDNKTSSAQMSTGKVWVTEYDPSNGTVLTSNDDDGSPHYSSYATYNCTQGEHYLFCSGRYSTSTAAGYSQVKIIDPDGIVRYTYKDYIDEGSLSSRTYDLDAVHHIIVDKSGTWAIQANCSCANDGSTISDPASYICSVGTKQVETTKPVGVNSHSGTFDTSSALIVAGGGGGSGSGTGYGGKGGGTSGENGYLNGIKSSASSITPTVWENNGGCGIGGTQTQGYAQGVGESVTYNTSAGGSGAGWYGGYVINGTNSGGAGGSGYINTSKLTNGTTTTSSKTGNGYIKITGQIPTNTTDIPTPTRTGHTFKGWTLSGPGTLDGSKYTFDFGSATVTANWEKNKYQVTCKDYVGSTSGTLLGTQTAKTYEYGDTASGADWGSNKTKGYYYDKYTLTSWSSVTVNGATTVYRYFERNKSTVTINPNGGSVGGKTEEYSVTGTAETSITLPIPTHDIYMFCGWELEGGGTINENTYTFGETDGKLTVKWNSLPEYVEIYKGKYYEGQTVSYENLLEIVRAVDLDDLVNMNSTDTALRDIYNKVLAKEELTEAEIEKVKNATNNVEVEIVKIEYQNGDIETNLNKDTYTLNTSSKHIGKFNITYKAKDILDKNFVTGSDVINEIEYTKECQIVYNNYPSISLEPCVFIYSDDVKNDITKTKKYIKSFISVSDNEDDKDDEYMWKKEDSKKSLQNSVTFKVSNITLKYDSDIYTSSNLQTVANIKTLEELYALKNSNKKLFDAIDTYDLIVDAKDQFGKYASGKITPNANTLAINKNNTLDKTQNENDRTITVFCDSNNVGKDKKLKTEIRFVSTRYINTVMAESYWGDAAYGKTNLVNLLNKKEQSENLSYKEYSGNVNQSNGNKVNIHVKDYTD